MSGKTCGCTLKRLGRNELVITPSNAYSMLLPPNPRRWSLLLSAHPTGSWGFSFHPDTKTINQVMLIPVATQALLLTREDFGAALAEGFFGIGNVLNMTVLAVEMLLEGPFEEERDLYLPRGVNVTSRPAASRNQWNGPHG